MRKRLILCTDGYREIDLFIADWKLFHFPNRCQFMLFSKYIFFFLGNFCSFTLNLGCFSNLRILIMSKRSFQNLLFLWNLNKRFTRLTFYKLLFHKIQVILNLCPNITIESALYHFIYSRLFSDSQNLLFFTATTTAKLVWNHVKNSHKHFY